MKIVINACHGGFSVTEEVYKYCGLEWDDYDSYFRIDKNKTNLKLIEFIEKYGSKAASGDYAKLKVIEIPDDVEWDIQEIDGWEWIAEKHRTWE